MLDNMIKDMLKPIKYGMCRLTVDGDIAIKTDAGYRTYDKKSGQLINCDNFVFDVGDELFFVVPTNKINVGDIILAGGANGTDPKYIIGKDDKMLKVLNYKTCTVENILPERHMFMGRSYLYGKIVSMFGNFNNGDGMKNIFKYAIISTLFGGKNAGNGNTDIGNTGIGNTGNGNTGIGGDFMQLIGMSMLLGHNNNGMFDGMFDNMFDGIFDDFTIDASDTSGDTSKNEIDEEEYKEFLEFKRMKEKAKAEGKGE